MKRIVAILLLFLAFPLNSFAGSTDINNILRGGGDINLTCAEGSSGCTSVNKFGTGTVAGAAYETIWDGSTLTGVTNYPIIGTTPITIYLSSSNTNDDQIYEIFGLDGNYDVQTVAVTANGFVTVTVPGTWLDIYRMKNMGSTDSAGNIYLSNDPDAGGDGIPDTLTAVYGLIANGNNQTLMDHYMVPAGKVFYIKRWCASTGKGDDSAVNLVIKPFGGVFQVKDHQHVYQVNQCFPIEPYEKVDEKSTIEIKGLIGASGGEISARFDGILLDR